MADNFLAEIRIFGGNFAPNGWAFCNGQLLPISQNTALFSLLGTTYGGNGVSNFALPNLQGNVPMHFGQGPGLSDRIQGEIGGEQVVTLLQSEIPIHSHAPQGSAAPGAPRLANPNNAVWAASTARPYAPSAGGGNVPMSPLALSVSGGGQPHNNMPPYLTLTFIIALVGIFPGAVLNIAQSLAMRCVATAASALLLAAGALAGEVPSTIDAATARGMLGRAPASFIENAGQIPSSALFYVQGADKHVLLDRDGVTFVLGGRGPARNESSALRNVSTSPAENRRADVRLEFLGANPAVVPQGEAATETAFNYFRGDSEQWKTGVRAFARVVYPDLWPGIDLIYRGTREGIKYSFVVHPGADPARIRLAYAGADAVTVDERGGLAVATPAGAFADEMPVSFQGNGERARTIATRFVIGERRGDRTEFGFALDAYDADRELVIDPAVNVIVGFLGAGALDEINAIAVDVNGNIYVAGDTLSTSALATGGAFQTALAGGIDAFVAKLSKTGAVLYITYLGGTNDDVANGIAADAAGNAYVTGYTNSGDFPKDGQAGDGHFRRTHNAADGDGTGNGSDVFVTKLNAAGTGIVYSGFIGGSNDDIGHGIALDNTGAAYITGETNSTNCVTSTFPVIVGPGLAYTGGGTAFCTDAFVGKIKPDGSGVDYLGFIGGTGGVEIGYGIAVNAATAEAYVSGETDSPVGGGFPNTGGSFGTTTGGGNAHAFLVRVKADGTGYTYAGTLAGNNQDRAFAVAIDPAGNAYMAGDTQSSNLSTAGVAQPANGGSGDPFVARINPAGSAVVYSTYLGGANADAAKGIAVDATGNAFVTGYSPALLNVFPTPGLDQTPNGANDAILIELNPTGTTETYAGYLGGASDDLGNGIAVAASGNVYIAGNTYSSAGFPVTGVPPAGVYGQAYKGVGDGFVAVIGKWGLASHFTVTAAPGSIAAGGSVDLVVTALDSANVVVQDYAGTVHFTSSDGLAVLSADYTFVAGDAGVHTFSPGATLRTAGAQTVTATDTVTTSITGTSNPVIVIAGPATHFIVTAPASAVAGTPFNFAVTALDAFDNVATSYAGTDHFSATDGLGILPADSPLINGTRIFSATLETAGIQTITATDPVTPSITGTSGNITVTAGAATHFAVSAPANATAGTPFNFTVTALDAFNNADTGYAGTVHFSSSDAGAVLPANSTLALGAGTFSATLATAGTQTITALDILNGAITGTSNNIAVGAGAATHFAVSAPASAAAGVAFNFTVTALDAFNNTATGYAGTVHFAASDGAATLPADSTLANGAGTFAATLRTAGNQAVTATDTVTPSITGTSNPIAVSAGAATHFAVSAPASAAAGTAFSFTVTALDAFNNTATGYGGTVHFTSSDGAAVLPANSTLALGAGMFSATLKTTGSQTITATDTVTGTITGTSNAIVVSAGAAAHYTVSAPAAVSAGAPFNFTVTAQDAFNNTATGYAGTVHFTSSDGAAVLPANATLANGAGTFSATLQTTGSQTITATDTVTASITGTSNAIVVSAAVATHFVVSAPASATAGTAFSFTVTAQDAFNNTAPAYAGTVHFTSTDGAGVLPANTTLVNGVGTFSATLKTAGSQTITATDTVTASITGASNAINVSAGAATHFTVSAPSSATAGTAFNFTITAQDAFNNTATGYAGTAHFTSSDGAAVLPANSTLANGAGTFSATLNTLGSRTITATDTVTASITGTSGAIIVNAGAPATITATSGTPQSVIVLAPFATLQATVRDASSNPVGGVSVTFAAPASGASVTPVSATVTTDVNGVATAPLLTANGIVGSYNVTATAAGVAAPANFALTNNPWLVFTGSTATGTGIATATLSGGGATCTYATAAFVGLPAAAPPNVSFPDGLFDFTATGCVGPVTLTIQFPTAFTSVTEYWKYGPMPPGPLPKPSQWYTLGAGNSLSLVGHTATFTITDGGLGDDDLAVNGTIVDQGGPGNLGSPAPSVIPALGPWQSALLGVLLLVLGAGALRRRSGVRRG